MAISKTYIDLQRHIADDIGDRTDLLAPLLSTSTNSPIKRAIQSAIAKWEREPFYFNEVYNSTFFTTVAGTEFYTSSDDADIDEIPYIHNLQVVISGNRYVMTGRDWDYLDGISPNTTSRGQPAEWAYRADTIRLYPVPDAAYTIGATRGRRFTALSADSDTNAWTTEAYDLVRCEAMLILAREVLHDDMLASRMTAAIYGNPLNPRERGYLSALKSETARRAKAPIRPTQF